MYTPGECTDPEAAAVLRFWFGAGNAYGEADARWFKKDPAFDADIRTRFGPLVEAVSDGAHADWLAAPGDCLARILVLDQFPRNLFRNSPRAFAADPLAKNAAQHALDAGFDQQMLPRERQFAYLPFEHSESLPDQQRCLDLMRSIAHFPGCEDLPKWAEAHLVIIRRFSRFPHRNAALGRDSTPEEIGFLALPGSGF